MGLVMLNWIKCILSQLRNNTSVRGSVDLLKGRKTLQRDINRLNEWENASGKRFSRAKYQVLHLDHNNPMQCYRLGAEFLESCSVEKDLRADQQLLEHESVQVLKKVNGILVWIRAVTVPPYSALVRSHLKSCVRLWAPHFKKGFEVLESVQSRATKVLKGVENNSYE